MSFSAGDMVTEQVRLARPLVDQPHPKVWLADQLDWRKQVVVKLVTTGVSPDALVGFVENMAQAAEVESPHVVLTFDHGLTDDGTPFVVMEKLDGTDLAQRMGSGQMSPSDVGDLLAQLASALTAVHAGGLVHGGVEPGNIFLCKARKGPEVKLLNLGIAGVARSLRVSDYVSPEQFRHRPPTAASDLWSLGAVIYQVLTGELPVAARARRQGKWDFVPPTDMWVSGASPEVDEWFLRALHVKPAERFTSAAEMATTFGELMPGIEIALGQQPSAPVVGAHQVVAVGEVEPPEPEEPESDPHFEIEVDD